jgi:hypothetical protein
MQLQVRKNKPKNLIRTLGRILSYYKGHYLTLFFIFITTTHTGIANLLVTFFSGKVTDAIKINDVETFRFWIFVIIGLAISGVSCALLHNIMNVRLAQKVIYKLRLELMEKMQKLPISYFDRHPHGEIMSLYTNDMDTIAVAMTDSFANVFLSATNLFGTIIFLFIINVPLSLIVIAFILLMFVYMVFNAKYARRYYVLQQQALADVNAVVEEDIAGVKVIKAFNHEKESYEKFDRYNESWRKTATRAFFITSMSAPVYTSLSYLNFSISCVLGVVALCTGFAGPLTFGQLQSYLIFTRNACIPFTWFTQHVNNILSCCAGAERIFAFYDEREESDEGKVRIKLIHPEEEQFNLRYAWERPKEDGTTEIIPIQGVIRFEHVYFGYVPHTPVLKDISFEVYPGKKIAFVGSTGAGKTTIISLLARFYPIDSGRITYDGIDIKDIALESLRRGISMVTQDTHLFTDTIENNIRYVRMHSTSEEVKQVALNSQADSFIRRTPEGYQTMLYDDGHNLSEGQRQLLGITRASLNRSPVMILDEATSNIDTRSELLIQKGLTSLMEGRSVMIIAHRLSTIRDCDEILVLDHGSIIERGTQEELLELKGAYYNLYTGKEELS